MVLVTVYIATVIPEGNGIFMKQIACRALCHKDRVVPGMDRQECLLMIHARRIEDRRPSGSMMSFNLFFCSSLQHKDSVFL